MGTKNEELAYAIRVRSNLKPFIPQVPIAISSLLSWEPVTLPLQWLTEQLIVQLYNPQKKAVMCQIYAGVM
jgi:hypothetical protein